MMKKTVLSRHLFRYSPFFFLLFFSLSFFFLITDNWIHRADENHLKIQRRAWFIVCSNAYFTRHYYDIYAGCTTNLWINRYCISYTSNSLYKIYYLYYNIPVYVLIVDITAQFDISFFDVSIMMMIYYGVSKLILSAFIFPNLTNIWNN